MTASLGVLTWNIFMMPPWTFQSPSNEERARAIAAELVKLDYEILCLEKAFDGRAREILEHALSFRFPHRFGPANNSGFSLKLNSGVYLMSRIPLTDYREIQFRDSLGIEGLSRKGALMIRGSVAQFPFQLVATHLQGDEGGGANYQRVRNLQMDQIETELIGPYGDPNVPLIVAGDFCTPRFTN